MEAERAGAREVPALCFRGVTFAYGPEAPPAVTGVDLEVGAGELVALVGKNGSGKSTVARLANGLLLPQEGTVSVEGLITAEPGSLWDVRARVGLLFQDPEDQIVGTTVADDVAFGLENLGVSRPEMHYRVGEALEKVGLAGEAGTEPHLLSGGQKQRLALAAVLVLRPSVLILDEPTSMLDPPGRRAVRRMLDALRNEGVAVVAITQRMDEVVSADRAVLLEQGEVVYQGTPRVFFTEGHGRRLGRSGPESLAVATELAGRGLLPNLPETEAAKGRMPLTEDELVSRLVPLVRESTEASAWSVPAGSAPAGSASGRPSPAAAELANVSVTYHEGTPFSRSALREVDVRISEGSITAVMGPTASGKSTFLMTAAGLIPPSCGDVRILGETQPPPGEVGMVFQRPEMQLFSATAWDDVAVAPQFRGLRGDRLKARVDGAFRCVGLDPAEFGSRPPWELSEGEQRRVAVAGVLSLDPSLLVLDEPGAGLDPAARSNLMKSLVAWQREGLGGPNGQSKTRTLMFSTHEVEEAGAFCDCTLVLSEGRVQAHGSWRAVLSQRRLLDRVGLEAPFASRIAARLGASEACAPLVPGELVDWIAAMVRPAEEESGS